MFFFLHRVYVLLLIGLVVLGGYFLWMKRSVFSPVIDLVDAWQIKTGVLQSEHGTIEGTVVKVFDGELFQLAATNNQNYTVKLTAIDAAELPADPKARKQSHGEKSREFLSSLVLSNKVMVKITYPESGNRILGWATCNGTNINFEMVRLHYARPDHQLMNGLSLRDKYDFLRAARIKPKPSASAAEKE